MQEENVYKGADVRDIEDWVGDVCRYYVMMLLNHEIYRTYIQIVEIKMNVYLRKIWLGFLPDVD